ncbi:trichohyalin-like [Ictidomys tridecemlineatus]|nr:trichohyalin-like [Ictidomys tridecemlineatus]
MHGCLLRSAIGIVDVFHKHARSHGGQRLSKTELQTLLKQELEVPLEKTDNSEAIKRILQQLDQDGDETVDFSEFVLLVFRVTKAYYACIKPLLHPELKVRERRCEVQGQQATEPNSKQLEEEKLQEKVQNPDPQDVQRQKVRDQIPTAWEESEGVRQENLESQPVRSHQDLSPEPQDLRRHHLKDQTERPTGNRRYHESHQSLRYQDAGSPQVRGKVPMLKDAGRHGVQEQSLDSQDVRRHQEKDGVTTLTTNESHQVRDLRQESQDVPQHEARSLNPEPLHGEEHQTAGLIPIPRHDRRPQVRDSSVEHQDGDEHQVRDMRPKSQDLRKHQARDLNQVGNQIPTPRNEGNLPVGDQRQDSQDMQEYLLRNQMSRASDDEQQARDPSPEIQDSERRPDRDQTPPQGEYQSLQIRDQRLEGQDYPRQPGKEQILEPRVDEHHQVRIQIPTAKDIGRSQVREDKTLVSLDVGSQQGRKLVSAPSNYGKHQGPDHRPQPQDQAKLQGGAQTIQPGVDESNQGGNQTPTSVNEVIYQKRDQLTTSKDDGRYHRRHQSLEFKYNTRQQNGEQTPTPKTGAYHQVKSQNPELSNSEMQTGEQRLLPRKNEVQQVSYQTTSPRSDDGRYPMRELSLQPNGDEARQIIKQRPEVKEDEKRHECAQSSAPTDEEKHPVRKLNSEVASSERQPIREQRSSPREDEILGVSDKTPIPQDNRRDKVMTHTLVTKNGGKHRERDLSPEPRHCGGYPARDQTPEPRNDGRDRVRDLSPEHRDAGRHQFREHRPASKHQERVQDSDLTLTPKDDGKYQVRDLNPQPMNDKRYQDRDQRASSSEDERHRVRDKTPASRDEGRYQARDLRPKSRNDQRHHAREQRSDPVESERHQVTEELLASKGNGESRVREQRPAPRLYERFQPRDHRSTQREGKRSQRGGVNSGPKNDERRRVGDQDQELSSSDSEHYILDKRRAPTEIQRRHGREISPAQDDGRHQQGDLSPEPQDDGGRQVRQPSPASRQFPAMEEDGRSQMGHLVLDGEHQVREQRPEPRNKERQLDGELGQTPTENESHRVRDENPASRDGGSSQVRGPSPAPRNGGRHPVREQEPAPRHHEGLQQRGQRRDTQLGDSEHLIIPAPRDNERIHEGYLSTRFSNDGGNPVRIVRSELESDRRTRVREQRAVQGQCEGLRCRDQVSAGREEERSQQGGLSPQPSGDERVYSTDYRPALRHCEGLPPGDQVPTQEEGERSPVTDSSPRRRIDRRNQEGGLSPQSRRKGNQSFGRHQGRDVKPERQEVREGDGHPRGHNESNSGGGASLQGREARERPAGEQQEQLPRQEGAVPRERDPQEPASTRKIGPITCELYFFPNQKGRWLCDLLEPASTRDGLHEAGLGTFKNHKSRGSHGYYPTGAPGEEYLHQDEEERWKDDADDQQDSFCHVGKCGRHTSSSEDEF